VVEERVEPTKDNSHLEELIKNLQAEIEALKQANAGLNDKVKEMSHEPSTKPVNPQAKPSAGDAYAQWRETMRNLVGN
jgi:FtsZ-binding cell division protein ZapB